MWKTVIYQGVIYDNLEINENGDLRNKTTELIYKSNPIGLGYNAVCISMGSRKNRKVIKNHKAVAETFIPNPNNYPCINHKDGNKLNNKVDNLEWCTYKQNTQHALKNNLIDLSKRAKENNSNAKLKQKDVDYIRDNYIPYDKKFGMRALSRVYGVNKETIRSIIHRRNWA